jgi:RND family efflux transporter MFP subunit
MPHFNEMGSAVAKEPELPSLNVPSLLALLVASALTASILTACSKEESPPPPAPRTVRAIRVEVNPLGTGGQASGTIQSRYNANVGFLVGGRMIERLVDIGSLVKKGDVLARLDPVDYQNKLAAAESDVTAAQSVVAQAAPQEQRLRTLLKQGFTTQVNYDVALRNLNTAQASLQQAQAKLRLAQDQLAYATLKADSDGVISQTGADPGQVVNAGQMIVVLSQLSVPEAVFAVGEQAVARLPRDIVVHVSLQSNPKVTAEGHIREVSPTADPITGTYTMKVSLTDPPEAMRLGAVVTGSVHLEGEDVAVIPTSALLQSGSQSAVWLVDPKALVVHRRLVKMLQFDADTVTISEGLKQGDIVVTAGVNVLAEGQKVALPDKISP